MSRVSGHPYSPNTSEKLLATCLAVMDFSLRTMGNREVKSNNEKIAVILEVKDVTCKFSPRNYRYFLTKAWGWFWLAFCFSVFWSPLEWYIDANQVTKTFCQF